MAASSAGASAAPGLASAAMAAVTNPVGAAVLTYGALYLKNNPEGTGDKIAYLAISTCVGAGVGAVFPADPSMLSGEPVRGLTDYIASCESGMNPNIVNGGAMPMANGHMMSDWSIGDVIGWQETHGRLAAGMHQFVPSTLGETAEHIGMPLSATFSTANQHQLAAGLLDMRGLGDYVAGGLSDTQMLGNITDTWVCPMDEQTLLNHLHHIKNSFSPGLAYAPTP